jgi:hypothetical protein
MSGGLRCRECGEHFQLRHKHDEKWEWDWVEDENEKIKAALADLDKLEL